MKYKLLAVSTVPEINIGDYVQALASSQFYPTIDGFIEREEIDEYKGETSKMIMNGYYMHDGNHWPPSEYVLPLLVAVHINSIVRPKFATKKSIDFLKQYQPIGCRDYDTMDFLKECGVEAYFSGCMTLTLGYKYKYNGTRDGVYFVDPKVTFKNRWEKLGYYLLSLLNIKIVESIGVKWLGRDDLRANEKSKVMKFYIKYKALFSKETLLNSFYIQQESSIYNTQFPSNEERLAEAKRLVVLYSKAALVVTSRIHCALPCLGLETPVLFVNNIEQAEWSSCRLRGLLELFNVLEWSNNGLKAKFQIKGKLSANNHPLNKDTWKPIAKSLIEKCQSFMGINRAD